MRFNCIFQVKNDENKMCKLWNHKMQVCAFKLNWPVQGMGAFDEVIVKSLGLLGKKVF